MKLSTPYNWRFLFAGGKCCLLLSIFTAAFLSSCGDEDLELPTGDQEKNTVQSTTLSEWEVARLLFAAGFRAQEIDTMICIAKYESGLRADAVGRSNVSGRARGSKDIGLFQINSYWWARSLDDGGCGISEQELFNPEINTQCARRVFKRHGFNGWVAYKKNQTTCNTYLADLRRPRSVT